MRLRGKVALITGAAGGIGRAYAQRFLEEGAAVAVADVDESGGRSTVEWLASVGETAFVHVDVADPVSAQRCTDKTVELFGRLDILVNNAALYGNWEMTDHSYDYLRRVFEVNLHSLWLMTRAASGALIESGGGRVINQSSTAAYNYRYRRRSEEFPGLSSFNYMQTKWGVVGLTKYLAGQLGHWNVTVNCIAPGVIHTEATMRVLPDNIRTSLFADQALGVELVPEDLTGTAVYLASDDARYVTGQVIVIDGGLHMPG